MNKQIFQLLSEGLSSDVVLRHYTNIFKQACKDNNLVITRNLLDYPEDLPNDVKITFANLKDYVSRVVFKKVPSFDSRITKRMHSEAYHESLRRDPALLSTETIFIGERDGSLHYSCNGCDVSIIVSN